MALNFNVSPYYDDFDPTKNYHRILFKPGVAVQARELTQSQTILQNQISNFANHIFTQNTPVSGAKVTVNLDCHYIKLNLQYNNVNIVASDFLNKVIMDESGSILARVIATAETTGTSTVVGDPPTLIVSYISGLHFSDGMKIFPTDGTNISASTIGTKGGKTSIGEASVASISSGIFYIVNGYSQSPNVNDDGTYTKYSIGNFVQVNPQTIILEKYNNDPTYRVGLEISETIYDYVDDPSLLDPAVGASNYQAPGADRYVVDLTLIKLPLTVGNDSQFIELVRTDAGKIVKQIDSTGYSVIDDYFAKRDYESNGDYIVSDFKLTPSQHKTDSAKYNLIVGPGVAYVHGYRIDSRGPTVLQNDRSRSTKTVNVKNTYVDYGNYFYVDTINGSFDTTKMPTVNLHCVEAVDISAIVNGDSANTNTYNSTLVGTAKIRGLDYVTDGGSSNTKSYVYQAYLTDITTTVLSGTAKSSGSNTTTLAVNDSGGKFTTVNNAYKGMILTVTSGTSAGDRRTVTSYSGSTKAFTVNQDFTLTPDSTTTFSITMATKDVESIVVPSGTNSFSANSNINILSRVGNRPTADAVLKSPGGQELIFEVGNPYVSSVTNSNYTTTRAFRNQSFSSTTGLTLSLGTEPFNFIGNGVLSSDTIKENYTVIDKTTGAILDFTSSGETVTVTSGTQVTFESDNYATTTVDVLVKVEVTHAYGGSDSGQVLKIKNLVQGNTSTPATSWTSVGSYTKVSTAKGQVLIENALAKSSPTKLSLYVSDVKKIVKIIDTGSSSVDPTSNMLVGSSYDVTNKFSFNNGQKDSYYDHAYISLLPGANAPKGKLLVIFDYYSHTGGDGVFTVLSYLGSSSGGSSSSPEAYSQIPYYKTTSGTTYKLSDCIDFRPTRKNAVSTFVFDYHDTDSSTQGCFIPVNLTNFESRYSYYLGRKDLVVLSKDKNFQIIQGRPSVNPIYPSQPDGTMLIANLAHDPYTAFIPGENPSEDSANLSITKVLHKRWTKSDITDLQTRVNDLEYYTSLSLLEQKAQALQVPDENGLNRFKNGILVDDFSSFGVADTGNDDYQANIDTRNGKLMPITPVLNYQLQNPDVLKSLATLNNNESFHVFSVNGGDTNLFTLPYTTANVVVQQLASGTVSVNPFNVVNRQGSMLLSPPMDNWVDTAIAPGIMVTNPANKIVQKQGGVNLTNCGDFAQIPGTSISPEVGTTQKTNSGVASSMMSTNGYVQNVSILPYIRPQELGFRGHGFLVNTPLSCWFDDVNVDRYITTPDTVILKNVTGTFQPDDILGFYYDNEFQPVARVLGSYTFGDTTSPYSKVRLYVNNIPDTPVYSPTQILQNGKFDNGGFYIANSATASGTLVGADENILPSKNSGLIRGIGDFYVKGSLTPITIFKMTFKNGTGTQAWCSFLNKYGIWKDTTDSATFSYSAIFTPDVAGNYTFECSSTGTSVSVVANTGSSIYSSGAVKNYQTTTSTVNITSGQVGNWFTIAMNVSGSTDANGYPFNGFALTVKDPTGKLVFDTVTPPEVIYKNLDGGQEKLPGGGQFFTGVNTVYLAQDASANTDYYVGSQINITSKFVYEVVQGTATYHPPVYVPGTSPDGDNAYTAPAYITYDYK